MVEFALVAALVFFFAVVFTAIGFFAFLGSVAVLPARVAAVALPVCTIPTFWDFSVDAAVFREVFTDFLLEDPFLDPFLESNAITALLLCCLVC